MTSILLAGPALEPVTLAEAKAFLRVDTGDEDDLIATLIAAARIHTEVVTRRAMIDQSWRLALDTWPEGREIRLPIAPLRAVSAIRVFDAEGEETGLPLAQFIAETGSMPARLILPSSIPGPDTLRPFAAIEIDYLAGYGEAAADVPAPLKQAVLSLVAHWFEHRDAVIMAGSGAVVPSGFDRLVEGYRQVAL